VLDPNSIQRLEMAAQLMDMASPLGKELALSQVAPCMDVLLNDENTNVRLAVINKLSSFLETVGTDEYLVKLISRLAKDKNWRVRHAVMMSMLPELAKKMPEAAWTAEFGSYRDLETWAVDNCALIRTDWCKIMGVISETNDAYGQSWLSKNVVPVLTSRDKAEKNYQVRMVVLEGTVALASKLPADELQTTLGPAVLELCDDKVPNVRIEAMKAMKALAENCSADYTSSKLLPVLEAKGSDEDPDVVSFAKKAIEKC